MQSFPQCTITLEGHQAVVALLAWWDNDASHQAKRRLFASKCKAWTFLSRNHHSSFHTSLRSSAGLCWARGADPVTAVLGRSPTPDIRNETQRTNRRSPPRLHPSAGIPPPRPAAWTDPSSAHRLAEGFSGSVAHGPDLTTKSQFRWNTGSREVNNILQECSFFFFYCWRGSDENLSIYSTLQKYSLPLYYDATTQFSGFCWILT